MVLGTTYSVNSDQFFRKSRAISGKSRLANYMCGVPTTRVRGTFHFKMVSSAWEVKNDSIWPARFNSWNPKQPVLKGYLVKQPFPKSSFGIIQLKQALNKWLFRGPSLHVSRHEWSILLRVATRFCGGPGRGAADGAADTERDACGDAISALERTAEDLGNMLSRWWFQILQYVYMRMIQFD